MKFLLVTFLLLSGLTAYPASGPEPTAEGALHTEIPFSAPRLFAQVTPGGDSIPDLNGVWIAAGGRRGGPPGGRTGDRAAAHCRGAAAHGRL